MRRIGAWRRVAGVREQPLQLLHLVEVMLVSEELVHLDRDPRSVTTPRAEERANACSEEEDLDGLRLELVHVRPDLAGIERSEQVLDDGRLWITSQQLVDPSSTISGSKVLQWR